MIFLGWDARPLSRAPYCTVGVAKPAYSGRTVVYSRPRPPKLGGPERRSAPVPCAVIRGLAGRAHLADQRMGVGGLGEARRGLTVRVRMLCNYDCVFGWVSCDVAAP